MEYIDRKYLFEFCFYGEYANSYSSFFEKKGRISIWPEGFPDENMAGMFLNYKLRDEKIQGYMLVLIREEENDLFKRKSFNFMMGVPHSRKIGHLILLKNNAPNATVEDNS